MSIKSLKKSLKKDWMAILDAKVQNCVQFPRSNRV